MLYVYILYFYNKLDNKKVIRKIIRRKYIYNTVKICIEVDPCGSNPCYSRVSCTSKIIESWHHSYLKKDESESDHPLYRQGNWNRSTSNQPKTVTDSSWGCPGHSQPHKPPEGALSTPRTPQSAFYKPLYSYSDSCWLHSRDENSSSIQQIIIEHLPHVRQARQRSHPYGTHYLVGVNRFKKKKKTLFFTHLSNKHFLSN